MYKEIIGAIFGIGWVFNAILFIPQILSIIRSKSAKGVSKITFVGFNVLQVVGFLHGMLEKDYYLAGGMAITFTTCFTVTVLAFIYSKRKASR
jgi:MtN3 and saliva related transmembrane protein